MHRKAPDKPKTKQTKRLVDPRRDETDAPLSIPSDEELAAADENGDENGDANGVVSSKRSDDAEPTGIVDPRLRTDDPTRIAPP